jgi:hypothetical protein
MSIEIVPGTLHFFPSHDEPEGEIVLEGGEVISGPRIGQVLEADEDSVGQIIITLPDPSP